jgi:predicted N-acyltransferase
MYGPALLTDVHLEGGIQRSNLHNICGEIENWADEHGLTLAVTGLTDRDKAVIDVLRQRDFDETVSHPTAELEVCWDSWGGYMQHLKHGRRKSVRREVNTFASSGCHIRRLDTSEPVPSACYDLLRQHQLRKNNKTPLYSGGLFSELRKNLPHNASVYLAEHEGRILGFYGGRAEGIRGRSSIYRNCIECSGEQHVRLLQFSFLPNGA